MSAGSSCKCPSALVIYCQIDGHCLTACMQCMPRRQGLGKLETNVTPWKRARACPRCPNFWLLSCPLQTCKAFPDTGQRQASKAVSQQLPAQVAVGDQTESADLRTSLPPRFCCFFYCLNFCNNTSDTDKPCLAWGLAWSDTLGLANTSGPPFRAAVDSGRRNPSCRHLHKLPRRCIPTEAHCVQHLHS